MTPLPPVLAPSTESPSTLNSINVVLPVHPTCDATGVVEPKENNRVTKGKAKLRPSGTKNGRNLCMLRWLKQVDGNGQRDNFREYYDKTLTQAQREVWLVDSKSLKLTKARLMIKKPSNSSRQTVGRSPSSSEVIRAIGTHAYALLHWTYFRIGCIFAFEPLDAFLIWAVGRIPAFEPLDACN
ncbi:hypothetical protein EDD15DRAFT_2191490 [Pisolithus albus]|nr:hypothetical protein EDD15DRAFT_2191490 [Pisolithus albus]